MDRNQLQLVILRNLCSGILPLDTTQAIDYDPTFRDDALILPESWVKGAMLLRINSLLRGHSGCRWDIIDGLHKLLVHNLIPCAPLRQSISASGDLAPLGYIAASLTDTIAVKVWSGNGSVHINHDYDFRPYLPIVSLDRNVRGCQLSKHLGRMA
jgi:phenylalanine ammonia-lyase